MATAKEYYENILKQASGVSEEKRKALITVLEDEAIAAALQADVIAPRMRQEDYSRNMNALGDEKKKWQDWYAKALDADAKREQELATARQRAAAYEAAYGTGQQQQVIQPVQQADVFSRKDFEAEIAKRDQQVIGLLKDGMSLASRHAVEFKEALDTEELAKIAVDKGLTLRAAYDQMVAPRRATLSDEQRKAEIQRAKDEAVRDYAAKHHIPVDTQPREYHPIFDRDTSKQVEYVANTGRLSPTGERQLRDNFVAEWNKAGSGTSGT